MASLQQTIQVTLEITNLKDFRHQGLQKSVWEQAPLTARKTKKKTKTKTFSVLPYKKAGYSWTCHSFGTKPLILSLIELLEELHRHIYQPLPHSRRQCWPSSILIKQVLPYSSRLQCMAVSDNHYQSILIRKHVKNKKRKTVIFLLCKR